MLTIKDGGSLSRALDRLPDDRLRQLLILRRSQLGGDIAGQAHFIIAQPGDSLAALEQALSFSPFQNFVDRCRFPDPHFVPSWEWLEDHGFAFEVVFVLTDDGFARCLFVEQREGVDPDLLALCRAYAPATIT